MKVVIIGGGITGLIAAYTLSKESEVETVLIERKNKLGGLASSFEIQNGHFIERYYHFICKPDNTYFRLMKELGIDKCLHWKTTEMGLFYQGNLYTLGDPISLFRFKHMSLGDKMRFGWAALKAKMSSHDSWKRLENKGVRDWIIEQYGKNTYQLLYQPLLDLKFRDYTSRVAAAWIWARFYRISRSRNWRQKERSGYLSGGSQLYIDHLEEALCSRNVSIRLGAEVKALIFENGIIKGVRIGSETILCDHCISTIPLPALVPMLGSLRGQYWDNMRTLDTIGVVVCVMRLTRSFSPYFWINISDPHIDLAGIIEYTNLNPCHYLGGDSIIYIPQYVSETHPFFKYSDEEFVKIHMEYLRIINKNFNPSWIKQYWVFRDRYSQPICDLGFSSRIPSMQTPVSNFYITDSHQLHPHDRSISDSSDLGEQVAKIVSQKIA